MARIQVMRFWKVELSPTYSSDLSIVRKVDYMSFTMKSGRLNRPLLICEPYISRWSSICMGEGVRSFPSCAGRGL